MIGLPTQAPLPVAFVPPPVLVPAANAIVPFALPSASGALVAGPAAAVGGIAAGTAIAAGAPIIASLAVGFGAGVLIGLAGLAIAQLWGQLNGKRRPSTWAPVPGAAIAPVSGTYSPTGLNQFTITYGPWTGTHYNSWTQSCDYTWQTGSSGTLTFTTQGFLGLQEDKSGPICGGFVNRQVFVVRGNGSRVGLGMVSGGSTGWGPWNGSIAITTTAPDARPAADPGLPPLPNRPSVDKAFVTPDAIPQPLPLPLPGGADPATAPRSVPAVPDAQPVTQPTPQAAPGQQPVRVPVLPRAPVYSPQAPTQTQQTTQAGTLVAPAPAPVPVTNPEAHFPYPGSGPITGQGVRPDLEAIAKEVGRIEQKVASLMNPAGPAATDRLLLLYNLLQDILNALTDGAPADTYTLSSPCVKDENGDRIVSEVQIPETSDNWTRITARVDALAELLQVHKDLKQPNCHIPPVEVGGEFVTVNFEQID